MHYLGYNVRFKNCMETKAMDRIIKIKGVVGRICSFESEKSNFKYIWYILQEPLHIKQKE